MFPCTVTVTAVECAEEKGTVAVHWVLVHVSPGTLIPKKLNVVFPAVVLNPVPVIVTTLNAFAGSGEMPVIVGKTSNLNSCGAGALTSLPTVAVICTFSPTAVAGGATGLVI